MELLSTLGRGRPAVLVLSALVLYSMSWIVYTRFFHPLAKIPGPWLASVSRVWYMVQVFRGDMEKTQRSEFPQKLKISEAGTDGLSEDNSTRSTVLC